jgi:hypothetical protein
MRDFLKGTLLPFIHHLQSMRGEKSMHGQSFFCQERVSQQLIEGQVERAGYNKLLIIVDRQAKIVPVGASVKEG